MPKSSRASARREESHDRPSPQQPQPIADKKRKRAAPAADDTASGILGKQQTIQELFSTKQQKVPQVIKPLDPAIDATVVQKASPTTVASSPDSKRQKIHTALHASSPGASSDTLRAESMYNFPSRQRASSNNAIDLTDSPTGSPAPRRPLMKSAAQANFNAQLGAKKIVVKNLRTTPRSDPKQYLNQTWEKLNTSLDAIFRDTKIPYSLEELYRGVENVCRQGYAAELCGKLEDKARTYAVTCVKAERLGDLQQSNVDMLKAVVEAWAVWNRQMVCKLEHKRMKTERLICDTGHYPWYLLLHGPSLSSSNKKAINSRDGSVFIPDHYIRGQPTTNEDTQRNMRYHLL
jgi:cullin-4